MARQIHVFRSPDQFLAGTIGQPGEREFYLQAIQGRRIVSVSCEKQQVSILAEKLGALVEEVARRFGADAGDPTAAPAGDALLSTPVDAEFRVGTMGLAWDGEAGHIIIELLALSEVEPTEDIVLEDSEEGPDALRVYLSLRGARDFALRADRIVRAGRPPCPLCAGPLDPEGHICPRLNGYHRGVAG